MSGPRIGRWDVGPDGTVTLIGTRCRTCGETIFPERATCPRCRSVDLEPARIDGPGKLLSWTIVHQAPPGFATPFAVGYGTFPGDVVILAQIEGPAENLAKGLPLRITEGPSSTAADGTPLITYRFAPDAGDQVHA